MKNFIILFSVILFLSCSSPQKSFRNGNYSRAYKSALKKLKKEGPKSSYRTILINSLTKILKEEEQKAESLEASGILKDKESAYKIYGKLLDKIDESHQFTLDKFNSDHITYEEKRVSLKENIGEEYFMLGHENLDVYKSNKLKSNAKNAHVSFLKSQQYEYTNQGLDSLIEFSLNSARLIYLIEPDFPIESFGSFELKNILEDLEDESSTYIEVIYDPIGRPNDLDCYIEIEINSPEYTNSNNTESREFEEEIITNSDTLLVKGEVLIEITKRITTLDVEIDVNGNKNCSLFDSRLSESITEEIENYSISGDERAIPSEYKSIFSTDFKDKDDVMVELLENLYPEIRRAIF